MSTWFWSHAHYAPTVCRLAAAPAVAGTLGILFCQILGAHVNWKVLSVVLASLNIPFLAALIFIPESPVFLITTNQIDRAHKVSYIPEK